MLSFDPAALIKGSARIGYRNFAPLVPGLPDYKGATAAVNLAYTLLDVTRFSIEATRDIQYSYDVTQPYYLLTGASGSITQQICGPLDVVARYGAQQLAYRERAGAAIAAANRIDHVRMYGGGIGYRLGRDARLGFNVDQQKRTSETARRQYDALRYGVAVTYGF
jgi:hypothetical protein